MVHLVRELLEQQGFEARIRADGFLDGNSGQADHIDGHGTFAEAREEDAPEPEGQDAGKDERDRDAGEQGPPVGDGRLQQAGIAGMEEPDQGAFRLLRVLGQEEVVENGGKGDRDEEGPQEGEDEGPGHGAEHLPFDALQGEDGDEDEGDDAHAEQGGAEHFLAGGQDALVPFRPGQRPAQAGPGLGESLEVHIGHDHGPIDQDAEIDGAEAEQAGCDRHLVHPQEREGHRQGNGRGDQDSRPDIPQDEEQDQDDEQGAGEEIALDRSDDLLHEIGAIVDEVHLHVLGQELFHLLEPRLQLLGDDLAVFAHQHEAQPQDDFALPLGGHGSPADLVSLPDFGDVADADGHAFLRPDDDVPDPFQVAYPGLAMDQEGLARGDDLPAAHVAVVVLQGREDLPQGEAVLDQDFGIHHHLVLQLEPAPGIDLGDARHLAHFGLDDPVVQGPDLVQGPARILGPDRIVEDLAQARGDGPELGPFDSLGQLHAADPLQDELAGIVDGRLVIEGGHDLGKTELGDGADVLQPRKARDGDLDGHGDLLLDFRRAQGGRDRIDLHLDRGGVGKGIHRGADHGADTQADRQRERQDDQEPVFQGKVENGHGSMPVRAAGAQAGFQEFGLHREGSREDDILIG